MMALLNWRVRAGIARQRRRVWIETCACRHLSGVRRGSPVSDDGCGLKQTIAVQEQKIAAGSPVSDDGCGLKLLSLQLQLRLWRDRPSATTGVD